MLMTMKSRILLILSLLMLCANWLQGSENLTRIVDLTGSWWFEIGNSTQYADPDYDESHWETIKVPGNWEDQGFPGYNGFAWYRRHFKLPSNLKGATIYLYLGQIDAVDRVYINGRFLNGTGITMF